MKLTISNIAWHPQESDEIIRILKNLNIKGIEIAPTLVFDHPTIQTNSSIKNVRNYWNKNGIDIIAMQSLLFGKPELTFFDDEITRKKTIEYLKMIIDFGSKLGVRCYVFGSPKNRRNKIHTVARANNLAKEFFLILADIAGKNDSYFCIEPNAVQYECNFINTIEQAVELVQKVAHPAFGLIVDTGNMVLNDESIDVLDFAFAYMKHFHISEPFLEKISNGKADHKSIGKRLRDLQYRNWISIEMKSGLASSNAETVEECLKYAIDAYI